MEAIRRRRGFSSPKRPLISCCCSRSALRCSCLAIGLQSAARAPFGRRPAVLLKLKAAARVLFGVAFLSGPGISASSRVFEQAPFFSFVEELLARPIDEGCPAWQGLSPRTPVVGGCRFLPGCSRQLRRGPLFRKARTPAAFSCHPGSASPTVTRASSLVVLHSSSLLCVVSFCCWLQA